MTALNAYNSLVFAGKYGVKGTYRLREARATTLIFGGWGHRPRPPPKNLGGPKIKVVPLASLSRYVPLKVYFLSPSPEIDTVKAWKMSKKRAFGLELIPKR